MKKPVRYMFGAALLLLAASFVMPSAESAGSGDPHTRSEDRTRETLESLRRAYVARDAEGFFRHVSQDPAFNWINFKSQVSQHLRESDPVELSVNIDDVLPGGGSTLVKIHWQKRAVQKSSGSVQTSSGQAQLIFKTGQKTELFDIRGDSPF